MSTVVIPARGGSKRIKNKNIVDICGKPLIAWTIETALSSGVFDRVIVSTDCPDIAEAARAAQAEVSSLRPAHLSDDHATLDVVIQHAIEAYEITSDWVCMTFATACLLQPPTLRNGADMAAAAPEGTDFVMGVLPYPHPIQRAVTLTQGKVQMLQPQYAKTRTQDLEARYHDAGQFLFGRRAAWQAGQTVWDSQTLGVAMEQQEAVDIDTPDDLALVKALMKARIQSADV